MGDEENFRLTTKAYQPPAVRCQDAAPAQRPETTACKTILTTMKASTGSTSFAVAGIAADEQVPLVLTERKNLIYWFFSKMSKCVTF
ncbi:hypothetical protein MMC28_007942 [Mycoblastus sanguinarius]|nr:hypothetical protein [Mycoblastus sanguinarius]